MEILWGWLVIIVAVAFVSPLFWWAFKEEELEFSESEVTQVIVRPAPIEGIIVDTRPLVVDELGEWDPTEHELEQPLLLSHLLTAEPWETLTPTMVGLVAA